MKPQFDILFSRTEKRVPFCGFECSPFLYPYSIKLNRLSIYGGFI